KRDLYALIEIAWRSKPGLADCRWERSLYDRLHRHFGLTGAVRPAQHRGRDLDRRCRPGEVVTLPEAAVQLGQSGGLLGRLDALGHDLQLEPVAQPDDGSQHRALPRASRAAES